AGFVQLERGVRPHVIDELLTSVTLLLAGYKVPESLEVVQEIPRDHHGKIDHNSLPTMTSADGGNQSKSITRRPAHPRDAANLRGSTCTDGGSTWPLGRRAVDSACTGSRR